MTLREALEEFKRRGAWSGTMAERKAKFEWLHRRLCEIYGRNIRLRFRVAKRFGLWRFSGASCYNHTTQTITLRGRLSVVTFLHEWGHALGFDEQEEAQRYAVGLFKTVFPEQFERLKRDGYCLVR